MQSGSLQSFLRDSGSFSLFLNGGKKEMHHDRNIDHPIGLLHFAELPQFLDILNWKTCLCITHGNVLNLWHHDSFLHIFFEQHHMQKKNTVSPSVFIFHSHTSSFLGNHSVCWFSKAFESEPCGSRRKQPSPVPVRLTNRWKARTKNKFVSLSHVHTSKVRKTILPNVATKLPKGGKASFRHSELFTKQGGTQTNKRNTRTLKKAHHVQTVTKIEGSDRPTHSHYSLSLHISQHIALLNSHSPSMLGERLQERGYRRCARNPQKKTCPHFLRTHHHRCSKQGFSGSHTSTHLSAQEKSHRPKGILLSHHVETNQHAFTVSAGMQGPSSTTLPRVQIRTNTSPQRFVPHLWHHAWALSAGSHWKPRHPPLSPSPSLPPPLPLWLKPFPVQTFAVVFLLASFSGFDLSMCLQLSFVVSHLFSWRVLAMGQTCFFLVRQLLLRISVLLMVPALITTKWLITHMTDNSKRFEIFCHQSCRDSKTYKHSRPFGRPWVLSPPELLMPSWSSIPSLPKWLYLQRWSKMSAPFHRTSTSVSMLECLLGSINFSQRLTFPQPTSPSRFIVKQDLDLPSLYLRQEPSVENS